MSPHCGSIGTLISQFYGKNCGICVTTFWGMYSASSRQNYEKHPDSLTQFLWSVEHIKFKSTERVSKVTPCYNTESIISNAVAISVLDTGNSLTSRESKFILIKMHIVVRRFLPWQESICVKGK